MRKITLTPSQAALARLALAAYAYSNPEASITTDMTTLANQLAKELRQ